MKWSLKLGQVAGIGIYVHWTFLILIGWVVALYVSEGKGPVAVLEGVGLVLAMFGCVVLHELGHSLMARQFGIHTRDITLLPIGGVARLERMPEHPLQELLVALAGPAVNVVIAAALVAAIAFRFGLTVLYEVKPLGGPFLLNLLLVNVMLVAFNLLPAFPMDGGRVLRALLATGLDYVKATRIAATVGQGMAILFAVLAFSTSMWMLLIIAAFIFLGAQQESQMVQVTALLRGVPVREAMIRRFRTLSPDDPLPAVLHELLVGGQQDFPVLQQDQVIGILTRDDLLAAVARGQPDMRVGDAVRRDGVAIEDTALLESTFQQMRRQKCSALPVLHDGQLAGMITLESVSQWMMVQTALRRARARPVAPPPPQPPQPQPPEPPQQQPPQPESFR